jgi:hypothetical protein
MGHLLDKLGVSIGDLRMNSIADIASFLSRTLPIALLLITSAISLVACFYEEGSAKVLALVYFVCCSVIGTSLAGFPWVSLFRGILNL